MILFTIGQEFPFKLNTPLLRHSLAQTWLTGYVLVCMKCAPGQANWGEAPKFMMRVYMYPAGSAGVALYTYKLANALADKGLLVTLFVDDQYELDNLPAKFNKARALSSKYAGKKSNGSRIVTKVQIIGACFYNSYKFYSYAKKDRPEIVHLHSFLFYPIEWYLLKRLKKTKSRIILTVHNVLPYRFYLRPFTWLELAILQYMYSMADKLIVHSEINKRQLLANFSIKNDKIAVVAHGEYSLAGICQKASESEARCTLGLRENQKIILFFGYIRKIKGVDVLLKAFDQVAQSFRDIVLIIAGSLIEGQSFSECRQIISRMKYRSRVRCFIKYIEHDDIPTFFIPADIVVLPYVDFYAQSGVLHLAQGFGKAVIVTDVGGLPEAVDDHQTGLIVPPGDVECLAKAITYLLENKRLRIEMGQRAKKMAMERFSWENIAKATIEKAYN